MVANPAVDQVISAGLGESSVFFFFKLHVFAGPI